MKKKIVLLAIALVIIAGIVVGYTSGFNKGTNYSSSTMINVYMTKEFAIEDIEQIVKETLDSSYQVSFTDEFKDTVSIKVENISEEKISSLKEKLQQKYEFSEEEGNIFVIDVGEVEIYDLVKEYIKPVCIILGVVLIYYVIAFRRLGIVEAIIKPAISVIGIGALYVSILLIFRVAINEYIIPIGIGIYVLTLLVITICLKNKSKKKISETEK